MLLDFLNSCVLLPMFYSLLLVYLCFLHSCFFLCFHMTLEHARYHKRVIFGAALLEMIYCLQFLILGVEIKLISW